MPNSRQNFFLCFYVFMIFMSVFSPISNYLDFCQKKKTTDGGYKTYRVKYMTIIALRMGSWDKKNYTFTKFSHGDMFEGRLS